MQDVALDANGRWIKCVLNAKNIVFHMTLGKYPNLGTSENFQKIFLSKFVFFIELFLTKCYILPWVLVPQYDVISVNKLNLKLSDL